MGLYKMNIEYYLPQEELSNNNLVAIFPEWTEDKIFSKTGVKSRHVVKDSETALDLAEEAANKLFQSGCVVPAEVDYLLLCTQSALYRLPSSACVLQTAVMPRAPQKWYNVWYIDMSGNLPMRRRAGNAKVRYSAAYPTGREHSAKGTSLPCGLIPHSIHIVLGLEKC